MVALSVSISIRLWSFLIDSPFFTRTFKTSAVSIFSPSSGNLKSMVFFSPIEIFSCCIDLLSFFLHGFLGMVLPFYLSVSGDFCVSVFISEDFPLSSTVRIIWPTFILSPSFIFSIGYYSRNSRRYFNSCFICFYFNN